jgi:hypothetical protein
VPLDSIPTSSGTLWDSTKDYENVDLSVIEEELKGQAIDYPSDLRKKTIAQVIFEIDQTEDNNRNGWELFWNWSEEVYSLDNDWNMVSKDQSEIIYGNPALTESTDLDQGINYSVENNTLNLSGIRLMWVLATELWLTIDNEQKFLEQWMVLVSDKDGNQYPVVRHLTNTWAKDLAICAETYSPLFRKNWRINTIDDSNWEVNLVMEDIKTGETFGISVELERDQMDSCVPNQD